MDRFSRKEPTIISSFLRPMPGTSNSRSGCFSMICRVSMPKRSTMSRAMAGPTPLTVPPAR